MGVTGTQSRGWGCDPQKDSAWWEGGEGHVTNHLNTGTWALLANPMHTREQIIMRSKDHATEADAYYFKPGNFMTVLYSLILPLNKCCDTWIKFKTWIHFPFSVKKCNFLKPRITSSGYEEKPTLEYPPFFLLYLRWKQNLLIRLGHRTIPR